MEAVLKREVILNKTLCRVMGVLTFVILTSLGAFVRIPLPFSPVPITLQTFFVLLSGALLGSNLGTISQLSYLLLGVSGLPVFTGAGSGIFYLLGPTGGYIFGFVLAASFVGRSIKYLPRNLFAVFALLFFADLILLSCGVIWLKLLSGYGLAKLLMIGFIPFIPGDLLKALAAAAIYLKLKSRLAAIF